MFESRYINYSFISFRFIWAKYGADTSNIRRDDKSLLFLYSISGAASIKDMCTDEIQFLVGASGSESFGFSFTGNSGMSGFGSGAAQGDFTRTLDLGIQRWGLS